MKKYCPKCLQVFSDTDTCPDCKKHPALEVPSDTEPVLLSKVDYLKAEMLKPLLKDAGIPALFKGGFADAFAMTIGMRLDVIDVLVPFAAFEEAGQILNMLSGTYEETYSDKTSEEELSKEEDT